MSGRDMFGGDEASLASSVIEPETFGVEDEDAPTELWVPTAHAMRGEELPPLALRALEDGQLAMLVFTSPEAFVAGCGQEQPYISVTPPAVQELARLVEADTVLWDVLVHPLEHQQGEYTGDGEPLGQKEGSDGGR